MVRSMTGFGRSELKASGGGHVRVEIKTINHKFLEISSRLPGHLAEHEDAIRKTISSVLRRGKINLFVQSPDPSSFSSRLHLNEALAKEVFHKINQLQHVLKLKEKISEAAALREVLHYPDVLTKDLAHNPKSTVFKEIDKALSLALESLKKSRLAEGSALKKDILQRLNEMSKALRVIEKRIPVLAKEYRKNLEARMQEFMKEGQLQHDRLTVEVAQFLKSADISEEVTRFKVHVEAMKKTLNEGGEIGRKIDFVGQEMTREANTMGSKSGDTAIANAVIEIKSAIEKVREQAQNIE